MTGQDGLRDELYSAVTDVLIASPQARRNVADAVLPVVQRHIDAAREQVADAEAATTRMFGLVNHARVERDAAVARAEAAEQAVARVRAVLAGHSSLIAVDELRCALEAQP